MPVRTIAGTDLAYALVVFDEKGDERPEPDGTFLSETLAQHVALPAVRGEEDVGDLSLIHI